MFANKLKMDSVAEAVKKIMGEEENKEKMSAEYGKQDQEETPARKSIKAHGGPVEQPKMGLAKEESEQITERQMTTGEKSERERLVKSMKKGFSGFRERYGKRAKDVMYATATKRAMGEEVEQIDEELKTKTAYVPYVYTDRHGSGFGGFDVHYSKESDAQAHVAKHGHIDNGGKKGWVEKHEIAKDAHGRWVHANMLRRHGMHEETVDEALVGNQKKLDKNHNNKLDAQDFKILRGQKNTKETYGEAIDPKKKTIDTLAGRVKVPADTHNQHVSTKVELKSEGWDDMMADVKKRSEPQPSGGSGVKLGSRYGGGKQKDKPEQDDDKKKVTESKRPDQDNVPFVTNESKPLSVAKDLAHKAMKRIRNEMLGKTGTSE